jgi:hypothetical protein
MWFLRIKENAFHIYYVFSYLSFFFHSTTLEPYDTDQMAKEFLLQFSGQAFTVGQQLAFSFLDKKLLRLIVKSLEGKHS